jgi:thiol-disulfide isomerase/thioredoxin
MYTQINDLYQSREGLSPEAQKLNAQQDSISKIFQEMEVKYLSENITIPSYYMLTQSLNYSEDFSKIYNVEQLKKLQKKYASKFKNHPYTFYSNEILWRFDNLKPAGNFFDFTLPDTAGTKHTLSAEIKGKYAFIDIWAPWCGPCIAKGREMKPVFEKYKDKDFTVVGVTTKYEELSDVVERLEKDEYPWLTLIDKPELNSRINEHYGTEKAGGGTFLVDKEGKIVLVNPSVEEVKQVLENNL